MRTGGPATTSTSWISRSDTFKAIDKLAANPGLAIYNLGTGKGNSVLEVVAAFEKASGRKVPYVFQPRLPGDIAECWADLAKAERELGWKAERDLRAMCEDALALAVPKPERISIIEAGATASGPQPSHVRLDRHHRRRDRPREPAQGAQGRSAEIDPSVFRALAAAPESGRRRTARRGRRLRLRPPASARRGAPRATACALRRGPRRSRRRAAAAARRAPPLAEIAARVDACEACALRQSRTPLGTRARQPRQPRHPLHRRSSEPTKPSALSSCYWG